MAMDVTAAVGLGLRRMSEWALTISMVDKEEWTNLTRTLLIGL